MKELKIPSLVLSLLAIQALAGEPTDGEIKLIKKYCIPDQVEKEIVGSIDFSHSPPLICKNGTNHRFFFEYMNSEIQISNENATDETPKTAKWVDKLFSEYLKKYPNCSSAAKMNEPYLLQCNCENFQPPGGGTSELKCSETKDLTSEFTPILQNVELYYKSGLIHFSMDPDKTSLITSLDNLKKPLDKSGTTSDKTSSIEWGLFSQGPELVVLKGMTESQNNFLWSNPTILGSKTPTLPTNPNNPTIYLINDSRSEPEKKTTAPQVDLTLKNETKEIAPLVPVVAEEKKTEIVESKPDPVVEVKKDDTNCREELKKGIAKLLEDDKKNIIGLQYELTVLKMAAQVVSAQRVTLEGLAKTKAQELAKSDTAIIGKLNDLYNKYGAQEDAQKVTNHLKEKMNSASYYQKDKRFFNKDSSAFLMAYREINPSAGINDSDISVLWLMDKVAEKSITQHGQFSAAHNLTNLSTRIAQYTGAINSSQALSKAELNEMVNKQKSKIDNEFLLILNNFKASHQACFVDGDNDCNLNQVETSFSELLAVTAKLSSTDLVSLDKSLKVGIDKTRFHITKYVEK